MWYRLSKNNWDYDKVKPSEEELAKLSYEELNAIFQMAVKICSGKYHQSYIRYYKSVVELLRMELDKRIQNKLFISG